MLNYLGPTSVRPYNYMYEPPAGTPWQNCEYQPSEVRLEDARSLASPPSIHVEGFELRDAPSSMRDFGDEEAIRDHYYAEAAELAHVSVRHLRRLIAEGKLEPTRVGRTVRLTPEALADLIYKK